MDKNFNLFKDIKRFLNETDHIGTIIIVVFILSRFFYTFGNLFFALLIMLPIEIFVLYIIKNAFDYFGGFENLLCKVDLKIKNIFASFITISMLVVFIMYFSCFSIGKLSNCVHKNILHLPIKQQKVIKYDADDYPESDDPRFNY